MKPQRALTVVLALGLCAACSADSRPGEPVGEGEFGLTACPPANVLEGLDISYYQQNVDFAAVKAGGRAFVITRVSDGLGFVDPTFDSYYAKIKTAGMIRGAYQYFEPKDDATKQADLVLQKIGGKLSPGDLPPVIDMEKRGTGMTGAQITAAMKTWLDHIEQALGVKPIIYTGYYYWTGDMGNPQGYQDYPMWVAAYPCNFSKIATAGFCPSIPDQFGKWAFWQYSDGSLQSCNTDGVTPPAVPGLAGGGVDRDFFAGTLAELNALASGGTASATVGPCNGLPCWGQRHGRSPIDIDGDGKADVCARGADGVHCWLADGKGFATEVPGPKLSDASGWSDPKYYATIQYADVNGDGRSDVCGRAAAGLQCWLSTGTALSTSMAVSEFSEATGWGDVSYYGTLQLGDVNGDHKADACGRGPNGFFCLLSDGATFATKVATDEFSDAKGWKDPKYYTTIQLADANGDGKADVCGRASAGFFCLLSDGATFATKVAADVFSDANGWGDVKYYASLQLGDVNGDGKADVCGRGKAGFICLLSDGAAFTTRVESGEFTDANGWDDSKYGGTIRLGDVNGDGKADVCGRSKDGYFCLLSDGKAFSARVTTDEFSDAKGWTDPKYYTTLQLGDVNGDGKADVCGRGAGGIRCGIAGGQTFSTSLALAQMSDSTGWGDVKLYGSVQLVGSLGKSAKAPPGDAGPGTSGGDGGPGSVAVSDGGALDGASRSDAASGGPWGDTNSSDASGCGCRVASRAPGSAALVALGALTVVVAFRRRNTGAWSRDRGARHGRVAHESGKCAPHRRRCSVACLISAPRRSRHSES